MPRRRRYKKKRYRKRPYKKYRKKKHKIPRLPFGKKKVVRHKYVKSQLNITSAAATPQMYVFRANSLYDPDYSGVGHQPFWYDQMSLIYNHWTVIGFKIKITARQSSNITTALALCLDADTDAIVSLPGLDTRIEQGTCKKRIINGANQNGTTSTTTMSYACNPNKFLGIPNPVGNSLVRGSISSNPEEGCFLKIIAAPLQAGSAYLECFVEVEYIAVWTEPKNGTSS